MTLTLAPITGTRLRALAERRGQTPEALIDALVERETAEKDVALAVPPLSPTLAPRQRFSRSGRRKIRRATRRRSPGSGTATNCWQIFRGTAYPCVVWALPREVKLMRLSVSSPAELAALLRAELGRNETVLWEAQSLSAK